MRTSTMVLLTGLVLLVALFGWGALGALALGILVVLLLAGLAIAGSLWMLKRRMRRAMEEVAARFAASQPPPSPGRPDSITVEAREVRRPRDGADDPDDLAGAAGTQRQG
jgi:hypothetical protein